MMTIMELDQIDISQELNSDLPPDPVTNDSKQKHRRRVIELAD